MNTGKKRKLPYRKQRCVRRREAADAEEEPQIIVNRPEPVRRPPTYGDIFNEDAIVASIDFALSFMNGTRPEYLSVMEIIQFNASVIMLRRFRERNGITLLCERFSTISDDYMLKRTMDVLITVTSICTVDTLFTEENAVTIAKPLIKMLRNVSDSVCILQAARLTGNVSSSGIFCNALHKENVILALKPLLTLNTSLSLQYQVIRAMRRLWIYWRPKQLYMIKQGVIECTSVLVESKEERVAKIALKALANFTNNNYWTADQINTTCYAMLVDKIPNPNASIVVYNLSHDILGRVELSRVGILQKIFTTLMDGRHDPYLISALCLLCMEANFRARLKETPQGFKLIFSLLMNPCAGKFYPELLGALRQFHYDIPSIKVMLDDGLVSVLMIKLNECLLTKSTNHVMEYVTPRITVPLGSILDWFDTVCCSALDSDCSGDIVGRSSKINDSILRKTFLTVPETVKNLLPSVRRGPSTSTLASPLQADPASYIVPSLFTLAFNSATLYANEVRVRPYVSASTARPQVFAWEMDSDSSQDGTDDNFIVTSDNMDTIILDLLAMLSYNFPPLKVLASRALMDILIDYMVTVKHSSPIVAKILTNIICSKIFFHAVLEDKSILAIHKSLCRGTHVDCSECDRLEFLGNGILKSLSKSQEDSGLLEGELIYRLISRNPCDKLLSCLTIPYVISHPERLHFCLLKNRGLVHLLDAIRTTADEAVPALTFMLHKLDVTRPTLTFVCNSRLCVPYRSDDLDITFILSDGSYVAANRQKLIERSPYFRAMLEGSFLESNQRVVKLHDISNSALRTLISLLDRFCYCLLPNDTSVAIELIESSDKYLLNDITKNVAAGLVPLVLTPEFCRDAFEWSVTTGKYLEVTKDISFQVTKFIFTKKMPSRTRINIVQSILSGPFADQFIENTKIVTQDGINKARRASRGPRYGRYTRFN